MKHIYLIVVIFLSLQSFSFAQTTTKQYSNPLPIRKSDIKSIKALPDGKMLVAGDIGFLEEQKAYNLVRLNGDGSLDETFQFKNEGQFTIEQVELLPNGNIAVLKRMPTNNIVYFYVLTIDNTGNVINESGKLNFVSSILPLKDDSILVVGGEWFFKEIGYANVLSSDLIVTKEIAKFDNIAISAVVDNDKIYIGGGFKTANDEQYPSIVKLDYDGNIDPSFFLASETTEHITNLVLQQDGKLIAGNMNNRPMIINNTNHDGTVRINKDGTIDETFKIDRPMRSIPKIFTKDGSLYLSGPINTSNDIFERQLIKLNSDGSVDDNFPVIKINNVTLLEMDFIDNDIVLSRSDESANIYGLARYTQHGNLINTFKPALGRQGIITCVEVLNEKIVLGGDFIKFNGEYTHGLALLSQDNNLDKSFLFKGLTSPVAQLEVLNDSDLLVSTQSEFFKLNSKAEIQEDFKFSPFKSLYQVFSFIVLPDNKILACGPNSIFRLNQDGTEDESFTGITFQISTTSHFDLQQDGKIIHSEQTKNGSLVLRKSVNGLSDEDYRINK